MPSWFTGLTVGQILVAAAGVAVVLALFRRLWRAVRPMWVGVREFLEDWRGEPGRPGVPERPGVMERLANTEAKLDAIDHELHPNSGESLRDRVDQINATLTEHIAQQQG